MVVSNKTQKKVAREKPSKLHSILSSKIWIVFVFLVIFGLVYTASIVPKSNENGNETKDNQTPSGDKTIITFNKDVKKLLVYSEDLPDLNTPREWTVFESRGVGFTEKGYLQGHRVKYITVGGSVSTTATSFASRFDTEDNALAFFLERAKAIENEKDFTNELDLAGKYNANCFGTYTKTQTWDSARIICQKFNVFVDLSVSSTNYDSESVALYLLPILIEKIDSGLETKTI